MATTVLHAEETLVVNTATGDETEMSDITREQRRSERGSVYQGCYLNMDLFNSMAGLFNGGRYEFEVSADVGLWHRLFPTIELGGMYQNQTDGSFSYGSHGYFVRVGAGYNLLNNTPARTADHAVIVGMRYCFSHTSYHASGISLKNAYWGEDALYDIPTSIANQGWLEFSVGVRTQICRFFFLGLWGRVKAFKHCFNDVVGVPSYTAGYGKEQDNGVNFGLAFTASYQFPYKR